MGRSGKRRRLAAKGGKEKEVVHDGDDAAAAPEEPRERKERYDVRANAKPSEAFAAFYKANLIDTGLMQEDEWEPFLARLRTPLPTTFWITATHADATKVKEKLYEFKRKADERASDNIVIRPLAWIPDDMGWYVEAPRVLLRKDPTFSELHKFLIVNTDKGVISRQEEASMVPAYALQVAAGCKCLDMCAAPGSKTAQMMNALAHENYLKWGRGFPAGGEEVHQLTGRIDYSNDNGVVVANDLSPERVNILVHQIKRLAPLYPLVVFTSHDSRFFPSVKRLAAEPQAEATEVRFDRILADVMCSGDGTMRKAPYIWKDWHPKNSIQLHDMQVKIALRAAKLLEVGGRFVYSTCSMSPIENEAAVAHILRQSRGCLRLMDTRKIVTIASSPGLTSWKVMCPKNPPAMFSTYAEAQAAGSPVKECFFPPADAAVREEMKKCLRLLPHQGDYGGFFVALFEKTCEMPRKETPAVEGYVDGYDSAVDEDEEEQEREETLNKLRHAAKTQPNSIEKAKAEAKLQRVMAGGSLHRQLAKYVQLSDALPDAMQLLIDSFGLSVNFPINQLLCRYHLEMMPDGTLHQPHQGLSNQILYLSAAATDIVRCGTNPAVKRQLRVVSGGLRFLVRDRSGKPDSPEQDAKKLESRFAQEAVELVRPYISKRIVSIDDFNDTKALLGKTKSLATKELKSDASRKQVEDLPPGGCVLLMKTGDGQNMPVSAVKTRHAMNVYVDDNEVTEIRRLCGV
eukprot:TRINITY_DN65170_c0_g1_i1.p1 TRINITY_DN65170_c0_g1~~TRINITY_DN65170_c0_g1_i1.p1  ORF type:complete len:760 (+),score=330.77 TRINITY_DN65170_c0_g1_i1:56-2281(+)